jgi:acetyl/propionyl-CoA carboxylase alpha subunit
MIQKIRIEHHGKNVSVVAEKVGGKLWFHLDGETHVYEPVTNKKETKGGVALPQDRIEAPMPGKILRVEVKSGDTVKSGQTLIVMEAMKMEYTLAAAHDDEVSELKCQIGEQVKLGQVLLRFKGLKNG